MFFFYLATFIQCIYFWFNCLVVGPKLISFGGCVVFYFLSLHPEWTLSKFGDATSKVAMNIFVQVLVAAVAAKSLQSCPTLCDPRDGSPPGSPVPGILQARALEWVAISFSNAWKWKVKVKLLSRVWLFATPWTAAYQAPPSTGFPRQEYWSGLPLPSPQVLVVIYNFISLCFLLLIYWFFGLFFVFLLCWERPAFSGSAVIGGYSLKPSTRASHCSGFSCCRAWALGAQAQ